MGKNNAKAWLSLAMIFALCLCIGGESIAATLRVGSSGEDVKTLQTKLKRWGYYTGSIDGVFGLVKLKRHEYGRQSLSPRAAGLRRGARRTV